MRYLAFAVLLAMLALPLWGAGELRSAASRDPMLSFTPEYVYFHYCIADNEYTQSVQVTNSGDADLHLTGIEVSLPQTFTLVDLPVLPLLLSPGESCSLSVIYHPLVQDQSSGFITFSSQELEAFNYGVSGNAYWSTIPALPYQCDFCSNYQPVLPGWVSLIRSTGIDASISTDWLTLDVWSCWVRMRNSSAPGDTLILASPPLNDTIPMNTVQFSFRGASQFNGQSLIVGILDDPADPASFTPVDTLILNITPASYQISLAGYTGSGRSIAFRHGLGGALRELYIGAFLAEYIPVTDLRMLSLREPAPVAQGCQAILISKVYNRGSQAIQNYQIKLFDSQNIELASVPGIPIGSGQTLDIPLIWTAYTDQRVRTELSFAQDQNNLNNSSGWVSIMVMPPGFSYVQIGTGEDMNRIPLDFYMKNSLYEVMLYPQEIGMTGSIRSICLESFISSYDLRNKRVKIWMGEVDEPDLSADWIPSPALTLVYDQLVSISEGFRLTYFTLPEPFNYTGGNLVIMVQRPWDTVTHQYDDRFYTSTSGISRSRMATSNSVSFSSAEPPQSCLIGGVTPNFILQFAPDGPDPETSVTPEAKDFGNTFVGSTVYQSFTIRNTGSLPLTFIDVHLRGNDAFDFLSQPILPMQLPGGASATVIVRFCPLTEMDYSTNLLVTDDQLRVILTIPITGRGIGDWITELPLSENFDNLEQGSIPLTWTRYVSSNSPSARLETSFTDSFSPPSAMLFYNSTDGGGSLILATPPLSEEFELTNLRIKFHARAPQTGILTLGVIDDPLDPLSFQPCLSFALRADWAEYSFDLSDFQGTGRRIAFRHGGGGLSLSLWLDSVRLELIPLHDLAIVSLSGNPTPTAGQVARYDVTVRNWGTSQISSFTLGLYHGDTCLATSQGGAVAPGTEASFSLTWTPSETENLEVFVRCFLPEDEYDSNDSSAPLSLEVQPPGALMLTLGNGEEAFQSIPFDFSRQNSLYEMLITHDELYHSFGEITEIILYGRFITQLSSEPVKVWMGLTDRDELAEIWVLATEMNLVFDGVISPQLGLAPLELVLDTAFDYRTGQNLVILFQRPMDTIYFNSYNRFVSFPRQDSRARFTSSNFISIDPNAPVTGETCNFFPKLSLRLIPGGVGNLQGRLTTQSGTGVAGVSVSLRDTQYQTLTDANGDYLLPNIIAGNYVLDMNLFGWVEQSRTISLSSGQTLIQNLIMTPYPQIGISGRILGSDTSQPVNDAVIIISGYQNLSDQTAADGTFSFAGVYGLHDYQYYIRADGYQELFGIWSTTGSNLLLGDIIIPEIANPAVNLSATLSAGEDSVLLAWSAPNSHSASLFQSFEGDQFPPPGWTQVISDTSAPSAEGLYPTWCRIGTVNPSDTPAVPTEGDWQAGLGWSLWHQDEWLLSPQFNCPAESFLSFDSYLFQGSPAGDHYYVKLSADQGSTWQILWDGSAATEGLNAYTIPISVDLSDFGGQLISLAWQALDPPTGDGLWHSWFIDNVRVCNSLATHRDRSSRALTGYRTYRLLAGEEGEPQLWTALQDGVLSELSCVDAAWDSLSMGTYRWAVRAVYTSGVLAEPVFSNSLIKIVPMGSISGVVRFGNSQPVPNAQITAGTHSTVANLSGAYLLTLPSGTYDVTAQADGFQDLTIANVTVPTDQIVTVNFYLTGSDSNDPGAVIYPTELRGNHPNPFSAGTTISYSLERKLPVKLIIYNCRGQQVRKLVSGTKDAGLQSAEWNCRDDHGRPVTNGIYYYRFLAGDYSHTGKMLLLK